MRSSLSQTTVLNALAGASPVGPDQSFCAGACFRDLAKRCFTSSPPGDECPPLSRLGLLLVSGRLPITELLAGAPDL